MRRVACGSIITDGSQRGLTGKMGTHGYVVHYDLVEAISQQNDNFFSAKERVLSNLRKHEDPQPPLVLHLMRPPVPVISSAMLLSQKDATELVRTDLNLLQQQAR